MDLQKTQHYTVFQEEICGNLIKYIPKDKILIEPFVGKGDLILLFPDAQWEKYDIDPRCEAVQQDTLLNPPNYKNKWVITNPPFLARNKASDKTVFNKYHVDDYYKAALISFLEAEGGILILPANFLLTKERKKLEKNFWEYLKFLK